MFYYNTNLEFKGATLLSADEASTLLTEQEREYGIEWWLRTPGNGFMCEACYVCDNGYIDIEGDNVRLNFGIRPALVISNLGGFKVGDIFSIGEYYFKIINPELAWLYKQDIMEEPFDEMYNNYETSHIKAVIDSWFEDLKKEMR